MSDFENSFRVRYEGLRWQLIYGSYEGVEAFAVNELQRMVQTNFPYVMRVEPGAKNITDHQDHLILVGKKEDNPLIASLVEDGKMQIPSQPESYGIASIKSPWNPERKVIAIGGSDPKGVLNGVVEFNTRILGVEQVQDDPGVKRKQFDEIPEFSLSESPLIENRGIWTWGYVIYDYRRFIDNMARLKMNMLTIWNDCLPINIREIIDYAHSRGIKIVLGFHWGWGMKLDMTLAEDIESLKEHVVRNYTENYAEIPHDGIYFQTLTETSETEIKGESIAKLACNLVNKIGRSLLEKYPDLYIQFGLHASSIMDDYPAFEELDQRITIVWEDAGVIPYSYEPITGYSDQVSSHLTSLKNFSVDKTIDYSKKIASIRNKGEFGMVPKGFCCLRWGAEFENHRSFILGERSAHYIRRRLDERQCRWDKINGLWMRNYPEAVRFYKELITVGPEKITATALVEDAMFEEQIQPGIALFSHILWNPETSLTLLPQLACSAYYQE